MICVECLKQPQGIHRVYAWARCEKGGKSSRYLMHESCSLEVDIDSKMHHANVSKESFSSPLRDFGSELMLYSGIMTSKRLSLDSWEPWDKPDT
jgi:hypothetical protein